jgi:uncharacterized protein (TIGR02217 family)
MTIGFLESPRFPDEIAAWLQGGRGSLTIVTETYGGYEYRNSPWRYPRGRWNIGAALRTAAAAGVSLSMQDLYDFALNCIGQLNGFRLFAPLDQSDAGHGVLGTTGLAVSATTAYQMYKNVTSGNNSVQLKVLKPVATADTRNNVAIPAMKIYNNGVLQTVTTDYTINAATGVVTFTSQPTVGHTLTWVGYYDIPVRFNKDFPDIGLDDSGALYAWDSVELIELKNL